ncbi:hypothetical protein M2375_003682 [Comamonas sp. BIGb0152]|nr:hypothetical protein [Comamonas sp. BIGb0152]MCS4295439.1 hypothetical protein [Comamonas sp. BIGb0152]
MEVANANDKASGTARAHPGLEQEGKAANKDNIRSNQNVNN